jgi:hypothetical protein
MSLDREVPPVIGPGRYSEIALGWRDHPELRRDHPTMLIPIARVRKGTVHEDNRLTVTFILKGKFDLVCLYPVHHHRPQSPQDGTTRSASTHAASWM